MYRGYIISILLIISIVLFLFGQLYAQEEEGEIIIVSERVGKEIDQEEAERFKFFQNFKGFQKAVCYKLPDNNYIWKITFFDEITNELKVKYRQDSESSINKFRNYIDHFEEIQAEEHKYQNLSKPQTVISDSGEIQANHDVVYQEPGTAFYLELGGKYWGSINVDFPIKKSNRISVGLVLVWPNFMYYYLPGDKNSRVEYGCGFTYNYFSDESPVVIHGVFGYRCQKKKGLLFRAGFTPMLLEGEFIPWIGISLGYSL